MTLSKTAVITGAGQGMGRAIALKFAEHGYHVGLVGRTKDKLDAVASEIKALDQTASVHPIDVTDHAQISQLAKSFQGKAIDLLVNCAGEALIKPFEETTADDWNRLLSINLTGPFLVTQALLPSIRQSENASVVNIGSIATTGGFAGITAYSAAKTGLLGLTRSLAAELSDDEIRVVLLNPGPVDTPMRWEATPDFDRKMVLDPTAIAETIWWLASLPKGTTTSEFLLRSVHLQL